MGVLPDDESSLRTALASLMEKEVILDTVTSYLYIGRLVECNREFLMLADADVRDSSEGAVSKAHYAFEASRYGYRKNRKRVLVRLEQIISVSLLSDVVD